MPKLHRVLTDPQLNRLEARKLVTIYDNIVDLCRDVSQEDVSTLLDILDDRIGARTLLPWRCPACGTRLTPDHPDV